MGRQRKNNYHNSEPDVAPLTVTLAVNRGSVDKLSYVKPPPGAPCSVAASLVAMKMYPNPFDRKHSTIRQVIDRLIRLDSTRKSRKSNIFNTSPLSWRKKTPTIASK
ncbi:hypothetical protein J6590_055125 [Homalodisca vitripennis]|nr:hypothetical protein J6590_055125 [Homalodisca vitripennis]